MINKHTLRTAREAFIDITSQAREDIAKSGIGSGICLIYCPHTTAGITINENADPDVIHDMLHGLEMAYPDRREFRHGEGNSSAHLKASAVGSSVQVIVEKGVPLLGMWQGIYFCEFDGPRTRTFYTKIVSD